MLANDARTLDTLGETAEELIKALPVAEFYPHATVITPPQGDADGPMARHQRQNKTGTTLYDRRHRARDPR